MSLLVHQDIFRLEVSINDSIIMKTFQTKQDFCTVESGSLLSDTVLLVMDVVEQLSSIQEVHYEVQSAACLK